jgi:hypothetical protein
MLKVEISCREHPRYSAQKPPRCACQACINIHKFRLAIEQMYSGLGGFSHDAAGSLNPGTMKIKVRR